MTAPALFSSLSRWRFAIKSSLTCLDVMSRYGVCGSDQETGCELSGRQRHTGSGLLHLGKRGHL